MAARARTFSTWAAASSATTPEMRSRSRIAVSRIAAASPARKVGVRAAGPVAAMVSPRLVPSPDSGPSAVPTAAVPFVRAESGEMGSSMSSSRPCLVGARARWGRTNVPRRTSLGNTQSQHSTLNHAGRPRSDGASGNRRSPTSRVP
jgi:hypothetical protein